MKTFLVYTGVSAAFQKRSPFTTENACHMPIHAGTTINMYRYIPYYLDGGHVYVLGAVEWGIYPHIYGYNNEHDVIVYTVVKDTQCECGQPRHRFQKSPFGRLHWNATPELSN